MILRLENMILGPEKMIPRLESLILSPEGRFCA